MIGGFEEPTEGRSTSATARSRRCRRTSGTSTPSSRATRSSRTSRCSRTSRSACAPQGCEGEHVAGQVDEILRLVGLEGMEKRKPRQLSGRPAAARRPRARARQQAARAAPRRAARRARPQAPQADAARAEGDPARHRHHVRPRHARPGRGDDDGRQIAVMNDGQIEQLGTPDRALRDARDGVRRGLPRRLEPALRDRQGADTRSARRRHRTCASRPMRSRAAPARSRSGSGPEKIELGAGAANSLDGKVVEQRLRRRRDPVHRRNDLRATHRLRAEASPGLNGAAPAERLTLGWSPESTFVVDSWRDPNDRRPDPTQLLQRAAAGGALAHGAGRARCVRRQLEAAAATSGASKLAKTLRFSNWTLYIDIDEKTKTHPSLDRVQEEVRRQGRLHGGHQRQRHVLREDPGPALTRPVDRPRHHRADRQHRYRR